MGVTYLLLWSVPGIGDKHANELHHSDLLHDWDGVECWWEVIIFNVFRKRFDLSLHNYFTPILSILRRYLIIYHQLMSKH